MAASPRFTSISLAGALASGPSLAWGLARAEADHGGALASAPMSPVLVGVLAGVLALAAGAVVMVIVRLLSRKAPPTE
jgi:hypothetical protein